MTAPEKKDYSAYQPNIDFKQIFHYFSQHPGLAIFILYSIIAIAGFIYLISFYQGFNLDVIAYLEITDILVAGIKEPTVLLMVLLSFAVIFLMWLISYITAPFSAWLDKKCGDGFFKFVPHLFAFKTAKVFWWTALGMLIMYFYIFIHIYSKERVVEIKKQGSDQVIVKSEVTQDKTYSLLGTSINYLFLYDNDSELNLIIPLENVLAVKPINNLESKNVGATKINNNK